MEGFKFVSALDLDMDYHTIKLLPGSKNLTTIVTEFGKFRYNVLPIGLYVSSDIFQAKINELFGDIQGAKAYTNYILVLNKGFFEDHIKQLCVILKKLNALLNVNANKCSFGVKEITYMGYIITQDGVKPNPKKFKEIWI